MARFVLRSPMPGTARDLFDWHARPGAFERLMPPWEAVRLVSRSGGLERGARVELEVGVGPVRVRWVSVHTACDPPSGFVDEQESGPFASWRHAHVFGDGFLEDDITWEPPFGAVGALAEGAIGRRLARGFRFRHRRSRDDLERHLARRAEPRSKVAITGASGLVGTDLAAFLRGGGHEVVAVPRGEPPPVVDAVVNLAGEPIARKRWSLAQKEKILRSRVDTTRRVAEAMAAWRPVPRVLVTGSAVGFYGDRGEERLTEASPAGTGFLADTAQAWEEAAAPARDAGIRVVVVRTGMVLSAKGGALASMLPAFCAGAGGPMGGGSQFVPWIHLDDLVGAVHHALFDDALSGPVNGTAPEPVPQRTFASALGRVLGRPAIVPAPGFALSAAFGSEMAHELLSSGQRAVPERLLAAGFRFLHADLEAALRFELGRG